MSFLQPLMLFALIGAAVPIIIHLIHKRRPRQQPFAAIEFVLRSIERVQRRWRLRRFLLLASRVLLLAALAFAAARPMVGGEHAAAVTRGGPQRMAIVIDGSLSMRAKYGDRTAFARAITAGRNLIDAMGAEDQALIVLAREKPELVVPRPIASRPQLLETLGKLEPTWEHADLAAAISVAAEALGSAGGASGAPGGPAPNPGAPSAPVPEGRVIVLSDLAGHGIRTAAELEIGGTGPSAELSLVDVVDVPAEKRSNHAITDLEVANVAGQTARSIEARVRIRGFSSEKGNPEAAAADITLRGPAGSLYEGNVDVVPGTLVDKTITHAFDEPGHVPISVTLEPDGLEEDDTRYANADVRQGVRALVVDGAPSGVPKEDEIFYLERALAAGAQDQPPPRVITPDDLSRTDLSGFDVVILAGVTTFSREEGARLVDFVEKGGGLMITASEAMDVDLYNAELGRVLPRELRGVKIVDAGEDVAGSGAAVKLGTIHFEHPIMSVFSGEGTGGLLSTRTRGYLLLQPDASRPATMVAEFEDGQPAMIEGPAGRGKVLLLCTTIDRALTDLPIRPAFLPLMRRVLLHLGGALSAPDERRTVVAQSRPIRVPRGTIAIEVARPDGERIRLDLAADQTEATFEQTLHPGHYTVRVSQGGGLETHPKEDFSVNVDARESDLRPLSLEEATAVLTGTGDPQGAASESLSIAQIARRGDFGNPERLAAALLVVMLLAFLAESALTSRKPGS